MVVRVQASARQLPEILPAAVARGIITELQAQQIAALQSGVSPGADRAASRLRPLVAEALGYVGGALVTLAVVVLVQQFWADIEPWGRVALLGAAAAGLGIAGWSARAGQGPVDRLRGFLWLLSAVAVAGTVAVGLSVYTSVRDGELLLAVGLVVAVYGFGLWQVRTASLQQLVVFAAVLVAVTAGFGMAEPSWVDATGVAAWTAGVLWASVAWAGWARPRRTGLLLGSAAALLGPITVPDGRYGWALVLGLATAGFLIAISVPARETVLLGLGVVGVIVYVPRIVFQYFGDTLGAPLSLLITGAVLVTVALAIARGRLSRPSRRSGGHDPHASA